MSDLTGQLAEKQRELVVKAIINDFLSEGQRLMNQGDTHGVMEEIEKCRFNLNRRGVSVEEALELVGPV